MIVVGTVVAARSDQALVKVNVLGRVTTWLPVLQQANDFKKQLVSMRLNQQVLVLANRYVVGSIFNVNCSEPQGATDHIDITEYADGTRIEYDTESHLLNVQCVGKTRIASAEIELVGGVKIIGDIDHQGTLSNTDGINTDGDISDSKGDLTSHPHSNAAPR